MLQRSLKAWLMVGLVAVVSGSADAVEAQESPQAERVEGTFEVAPRLGIGIPGGELWTVQDPGVHAGVSVAYYFTPYVGLRGAVTGSFLNSIEDSFGNIPAPDMTLIRFGGAVEFTAPLPERQSLPMTFVAFLGAGATSADASESLSDGSTVDFSSTVLTVSGGAEAGWQLNESANIFVSFEANAMFFDEEDTAVFAARSPEVEAFDLAWEYPVALGVRWSFR